jgi:hypothetical protein
MIPLRDYGLNARRDCSRNGARCLRYHRHGGKTDRRPRRRLSLRRSGQPPVEPRTATGERTG